MVAVFFSKMQVQSGEIKSYVKKNKFRSFWVRLAFGLPFPLGDPSS